MRRADYTPRHVEWSQQLMIFIIQELPEAAQRQCPEDILDKLRYPSPASSDSSSSGMPILRNY